MNKQPIILHIDSMLAGLEEEPLRAVYMMVKQMHDMQTALKRE